MAVIRDPRHQRILANEFGIRQGFVSPELEPSIQPVTVVSNLSDRDEWSDSPFVRRCARSYSITGDATHPAQMWLPPPPAGLVFVVRKCGMSVVSSTGIALFGATAAANFPTGQGFAGGRYLNRRIAGNPAGILTSNTSSALMSFDDPMIEFHSPTGLVQVDDIGLVLDADTGRGAVWVSLDNAAQIMGYVFWDEIPDTR